MLSALVITLREGLEAALIIGIILGFVVKLGRDREVKAVWTGVALAVIASLAAGAGIYLVAGEFSGQAEEIFEGAAMFLAAGILTWMIFWMRKQAGNICENLQSQVSASLASGSSWGLIFLAFVVVVREGIETALFLFASSRMAESTLMTTVGGLVGLFLAILIGYSIYIGSSRLNLRWFFNITSVVIILFAAGLLAHGIHEFHEAGLIPPVIEHVWDTNGFLAERSGLGQFLTAIVGYNGNPSLVEVTVYFLYLASVFFLYFRKPVSGSISRRLK